MHDPFAIAVAATDAVGQAGAALNVPPSPALEGITFALLAISGEVAGPIGGAFGPCRALMVRLSH